MHQSQAELSKEMEGVEGEAGTLEVSYAVWARHSALSVC